MILTLYDSYGNVKARIEPDGSSTQEKEIQGDNLLNLSFTLYEFLPIDVNDYVDYGSERYWAVEKYVPAEKSSVEWEYNLRLYGVESLITRFLILNNTDGKNEAVFTLTARPIDHVRLIVKNINDGMDSTVNFKVGTVEGVDNVTIDYTGKYCNEGLKKLAEIVGVEWWIEGETVNLCRCEHGEEITLGYDKGLTALDRDKADNVKFYTRLFPIGSSRNIDAAKYGHSRLMLPDGVKYVDVNVERYGIIHHYEQKAFADIYPRRVGVVTSVRSKQTKDKDGKSFTIYYFKDNDLSFDPNDYEIGGLVKHVSFQEGSELAGLGIDNDHYFEVNFNSDTKEFEMITIWPYNDDTQLPGGTLVPKAGDKYILWNIRMPDEYYKLAEKEFRTAVDEYNRKHALDVSRYKAPTDHVWIEETRTELFIGRRIRLESSEYFPEKGYRSSRITKICRKVNEPGQMDLEISDALSTGTMNKLGDDIADAKNYAGTLVGSINVPDVIRSWDTTLPTDNNLFSARRTYKEFVNKNADDRARGRLTFEQLLTLLDGLRLSEDGTYRIDSDGRAVLRSLLSENYTSGESGFALRRNDDGTTALQVDYVEVLRKAVFAVLERRELSHVGGDTVFSAAGSKLTRVEELPTGWKCYFTADDGTTATRNLWEVDDQAKCQTDNIREGVYENVSNRYYWRRVTEVGDDYIVLSKGDRDFATDEQGRITHDSDAPQAGDTVVQFGNRTKRERQNITMVRVNGDHPGMVQYAGVNGYSLEGKRVYLSSPMLHEVAARTFRLTDYNGEAYDIPLDKGAWQAGTRYGYHDRVSHQGSLWLCTVAPGQSTGEEPTEGSEVWLRQVSRGEKGDPGSAAVELRLDIVRGDLFYRDGQGFVAELKATVMQGDTDLTPTLHPSQMVWTRETEDAVGDKEWNARHRAQTDRLSLSTDDLVGSTAIVFTLYRKDGTPSAAHTLSFSG